MTIICPYYCKYTNDSAIFFMAKGKFTVQTDIQILKSILDLCDGELNFEQVILSCNQYAREDVHELLVYLMSNQIIVKSSQLSKLYHNLTMYPDFFQSGDLDVRPTKIGKVSSKAIDLPVNNSNFNNALALRKCSRDFGQESLSLSTVSELLCVINAVRNNRSYPSAGGFYPYDYIIYVNDSDSEFLRGWYYLNNSQTPSFLSPVLINQERVFYDRITCDLFLSSQKSIAVFLVCNFDKHMNKYGNRGYKFTLSEGGSIIQNACLYAAQKGLHILPYGGFDERFLIDILEIENASVPFCFLIGSATNKLIYTKEKEKLHYRLNKIQDKLVNERIIDNVTLMYWSDLDPKNTIISAYSKFTISSGSRVLYSDGGFGTGNTANFAKLKALMEVYERVVSSTPINIVWKKASDLDSFLNPIEYTKQNQEFIESFGLYQFQICDYNPWVKVCNYSETSHSYALMDQVYYGFDESVVSRPLFTYGNSSGVAAHFDKQESKLRAYFELVERDALMVLWYSKGSFTKIPIYKIPSIYSFKINKYNPNHEIT